MERLLATYSDWTVDCWTPAKRSLPDETAADQTVMVLGLAGECAEVAEVVENWASTGICLGGALAKELGDVLFYLARFARLQGCVLALPAESHTGNPGGLLANDAGACPLMEVLRLVVAIGGVTETFKKHVRDDFLDSDALHAHLQTSLVAWLAVCRRAGLDWAEVLVSNRAKLEDRRDRGVLGGSGNDR